MDQNFNSLTEVKRYIRNLKAEGHYVIYFGGNKVVISIDGQGNYSIQNRSQRIENMNNIGDSPINVEVDFELLDTVQSALCSKTAIRVDEQ